MSVTLSRRQLLKRMAAAVLLTGLSAPSAAPDRGSPPRAPFKLGLTPVILDERIQLLRGWREDLETRLQRPVEMLRRTSYEEIVNLLRAGGLDAAWLCGYPYVVHADELRLVASPLYRGKPLYRSYIIAGAPTNGLESLEGGVFAFADPDSNSGWLYPTYRLMEGGHDPDTFFSRTFFTWSHRKVIHAVAVGLADGGAVDGYVYETLERHEPDLVRRLHIVERSPAFGFPPLVAAAGLDKQTFKAFREALTGMEDDEEGRRILDGLNLDGFGEADGSDYDDIRRMTARVEAARR